MKKFIILSLVSMLVLAFGGVVYAQEKAPVLEFKASGFIDVISEYMVNVPQAGSATSAGGATGPTNTFFGPPVTYMRPGYYQAFDKKMAYMETRGRLKFDAIMGKELMGTFFFEIDSTRWGERAPSAADQRNYAGHWGVADRGAVEVKNMFLTFGMPWVPIPITVQGGIIPMAIRPAAFLATDGPGINAAIKVDPATIRLIWMKALENKDWAADDGDLYGVEASATISTMTVGGYLVNFNLNSYPVGDGEPDYSSNVWWYGVYAAGKLGPVNLSADLVIDNGKIEDRRNVAVQASDVKLRGWGGILNVSFPWEKFNVGFATIYGSGADQRKTSANGYPGSTAANGTAISSKVGAFIVPAGTEGTTGYSIVLCGAGINRMNTGYEQAASTAHAAATFGGLWINKLYGSFQVTPAYKVTLEAMYVRDTTKNGNTFGNAVKTGTTTPRDDKSIGWELDLFNEVQLYKNLKFSFGGGILFAGDAMDMRVGTTTDNKSPKNPWVITSNFTYSF